MKHYIHHRQRNLNVLKHFKIIIGSHDVAQIVQRGLTYPLPSFPHLIIFRVPTAQYKKQEMTCV